MAAPLSIAGLVNDVFYLILEDLGTADVLALSRCSRTLHVRLEPFLFCDEYNCDKALRWACYKDLPKLISRAVSHGGHVSAPIRKVKKYAWDSLVYRTLSLRIAAKHGSLEAFRALLDLGATANVQRVRQVSNTCYEYVRLEEELKSLLRSLCKRENTAILRLFLESGASRTMQPIDNILFVDQCLLSALRSGAEPVAIELLLLNGASPSRLQSEHGNNPCPLALAAIWNHAVIDLLREFGASLHGKAIARNLGLKWFHSPIFAAARQMHEQGTEVAQKLLAAGVKANSCMEISVRGSRRKSLSLKDELDAEQSGKHTNIYSIYAPLPIYIYLDSITSWEEEQILPPVEGLKFWLRSGLILTAGLPTHSKMGCRCERRVVARLHSFLISKWGWRTHQHNQFFHVLDMLTEPVLSMDTLAGFDPARCLNGAFLPSSSAARHAYISDKQQSSIKAI